MEMKNNNSNNIFELSYNYLDSVFVSIKNQFYDVFMDLEDDENEPFCYLLSGNNDNNSKIIDIVVEEEDLKGPMTIDELNNDDASCEEEDEKLNQLNTAFVLDVDNIDWNEVNNYDPYYDPHSDCVEYPNFLHNYDGSYGSSYDDGYDSY